MKSATCHLCDWTADAPTHESAFALWERHYFEQHPSESEVPF